MKQQIRPEFVEFIPETLQDGVLYISVRYSTAIHKCCCGCGQDVVTPLSLTDWSLKVDGDLVSLSPSIGNWSFPCRSHYFLERNQVIWVGAMSQKQIDHVRARDRDAKNAYFNSMNHAKAPSIAPTPTPAQGGLPNSADSHPTGIERLWLRIKRWLHL